ncbi:hypothetical protein AB1Y20_014752 [Prymnesium parvum]|uniref:Uncharacterized protein n=1 Tax=Prymnesium parvum TaxID=97485 RepID=A0AB34IE93_PRYPA
MKSLAAAAGALLVSAKDCGDLTSLSVGDTCQGKWGDLRDLLRPTQPAVGYAWVFRTYLKDMQSKDDTQHEMDSHPVPVSIGFGGASAYILDHHHHLAALDLSGHKSVLVTLHVSCDLSSVPADQQLAELARRRFAYLYGRPAGSPDALPSPISPAALPATIAFRASAVTMADDRWRALAGFSRKVQHGPVACGSSKYCGRAFATPCDARGDEIPFFEYRWAYFFNDALHNSSLWPDAPSAASFAQKYASLASPTPSAPAASVDEWLDAAADLVYAARSDAAGAYAVPSSMAYMAGALPGYVRGLVGIPGDDPDCSPPVCAAAGRAVAS